MKKGVILFVLIYILFINMVLSQEFKPEDVSTWNKANWQKVAD
jgi:hypothetical protein